MPKNDQYKKLASINLGSAYFDHYQSHLGIPVDNLIFECEELPHKIQILVYRNVFKDCVTFSTLGLSHYFTNSKGCGEIVCSVDSFERFVPQIIFGTIKTLIIRDIGIGWGIGLSGNENISKEFVSHTGKNCIYITHTNPFPNSFSTVPIKTSDFTPRVYLMILISQKEYEIFCAIGAEAFEAYLEKERIDPFNVLRK